MEEQLINISGGDYCYIGNLKESEVFSLIMQKAPVS